MESRRKISDYEKEVIRTALKKDVYVFIAGGSIVETEDRVSLFVSMVGIANLSDTAKDCLSAKIAKVFPYVDEVIIS